MAIMERSKTAETQRIFIGRAHSDYSCWRCNSSTRHSFLIANLARVIHEHEVGVKWKVSRSGREQEFLNVYRNVQTD